MVMHRRTRDGTVGPSTRPVAIPADVADPLIEKATGVIELPAHVRWSVPRRRYDLHDSLDRAQVYEQVLTEGTEDDVRHYIDVDELVRLWDTLVLPSHVRREWAEWLLVHRGFVPTC